MKPLSFNTPQLILFLLLAFNINAEELIIPFEFQAHTPAVAADVNANFVAIKASVDAKDAQIIAMQETLVTIQSNLAQLQNTISENQNTIAAQQTTIATQENTISNLQTTISSIDASLNDQILQTNQLQNSLAVIQANTVLELDGFLSLQNIDGNYTAVFTEMNVQIDNGLGTESLNGLGNLYLGYNDTTPDTTEFCLDAQYFNEFQCEEGNSIWLSNVRTGSHNLILGKGHSYLGYGAIIGGKNNVSIGNYSSVLNGEANISAGKYSVVTSGEINRAIAEYSVVLSGAYNKAIEEQSVVITGTSNTAEGFGAVVVTGQFNQALGTKSVVSGGWTNKTMGNYSSVSGGGMRNTNNTWGWRAGALLEEQ